MSPSMRNILRLSVAVASCAVTCDGFSQLQTPTTASARSGGAVAAPLHMSGFPQTEEDIPIRNNGKKKKQKRSAELSAVAITASLEDSGDSLLLKEEFLQDWMLPVLSSSFLITANTVGATCLVLPDLAAGPGFGTTCALSLVTYLNNLVSGLVMAEVAIKQYESSGSEVASSFKDFADTSFQNPLISNGIAWVSILTNAGVLAFTFSKAGDLGSELLGGMVDPTTASFGFVGLVGVLMSTMSAERLSAVASVCVAGLFASFAGLLLPGLAAVHDPIATVMAPGVADNCMGAAAQAFPIILLSLVYQNIVPSVTKILNYDRSKTTAALALGSSIPLFMYMAYCYASMGGGIDTSLGWVGPLLSGFTMATIAGSSVGTTMSVAEEFDSFFKASDDEESAESTKKDDVFSVPAVVAALAVPTAGAALIGGDDMTFALGLAGSIGTPLLYGVVPALMAWNQRKEECQSQRQQNLVPGGLASLGALGLASTGFVGQELAHVMGDVASVMT